MPDCRISISYADKSVVDGFDRVGPHAYWMSAAGPDYPGQLNRSTQHFILEGKDRL